MSSLMDLENLLLDLNLSSLKALNVQIYNQLSDENYQQAMALLEIELDKHPFQAEYLLTASYIHLQFGMLNLALECYEDALAVLDDGRQQTLLQNWSRPNGSEEASKTKIAFFVKPGLDNFLSPVITSLSDSYRTKKLVTSDLTQVQIAMQWADVCWFEWCDDLVVYASKLPMSVRKKIICRLHSYEAFTSYIYSVNWDSIDTVIFVGEHIRNYVLSRQPRLSPQQTVVIANGIDMSKFTFQSRNPGHKLAYVGYINHKKGPMLLIHAFKALHDKDSRYHLHIAGLFQDLRYRLYFEQMLTKWNLTDAVHLDGWQQDVNQYLEDKDYIMSASPLESQHMSMMEAMAKGIKPLVHDFYGADEVYDRSFIWSTIDEFVQKVTEPAYDSQTYRDFIKNRYEAETQLRRIHEEVDRVASPHPQTPPLSTHPPLVTIGIINYNYSRFLDEVLRSALNQTYKNLEILVVDDDSQDDSVEKIRNYMSQYPRVRGIFHPENTGTEATAIAEILHQAKGDFLVLLNADDFLPDDHVISEYIELFNRDPRLDYVYGDLLLVNDASQITGRWNYQQYRNEDVIRLVFQRKGSGVIPMAGMMKLDFYRKHKFEWVVDKDNTNAGDTLNCLVNIKRGWTYLYHPQPILCHRRHESNRTYDITRRIKSMVSVIDYIAENFDPEIYLPHIPWQTLSDPAHATAQKNFSIALIYWQMYQDYAKTAYVVALNERGRADCLRPLVDKIRMYFHESLAAADTHAPEIAQFVATLPEDGEGAG